MPLSFGRTLSAMEEPLVSEHLAGRCGALLGAPVAVVVVISVSEDLVRDGLVVLGDGRQAANGLQHGSQWVEPFGDSQGRSCCVLAAQDDLAWNGLDRMLPVLREFR
jgi:hypothetical protein